MSKREKIKELLQSHRTTLANGQPLAVAFNGPKEYVKQTIYLEARKLLDFPISVTLTDTGLQIRRREETDFNINIIPLATPRPNDPQLDPDDLDL